MKNLLFFRLSIIIVIVFIILCGNFYIVNAQGEEASLIEEQTKSSNIKNIENQLDKYKSNGIKEILPDYDPRQIIDQAVKGKVSFNAKDILNNLLKILLKEVYQNVDIFIKLIVLIVFCAVLKNLQTSFLSESVGELAFYVCYIVIVSVLLVSFNSVLKLCSGIIDSMVLFMQATLPIMISLLVSSGNISSAGIFQPVLIMVVEVSATVIKSTIIPIIFLSTLLSIVNNLSERYQISKLADFLKQIALWSLGFIVTIFIAIISVQGTIGAVVDGVTSKTAKFAIGAFIPFAGKYLADAADTVIGCTLLIKNAAGLAVLIGILAICLVPLIKILAIMGIYRLVCVIIEPISEKRIITLISDMANSTTYFFGIVAIVVFMFMISVTALIGASNISAMIR